MQRYRLAWITNHRYTYEVAVADAPAGRIEIDPAGTGQIDLEPGMRVATASMRIVVVASRGAGDRDIDALMDGVDEAVALSGADVRVEYGGAVPAAVTVDSHTSESLGLLAADLRRPQ